MICGKTLRPQAVNFSVVDDEFTKETMEERKRERTERTKMWHKVLLREEKELEREMQLYDDILMVDVVDVYRNLPMKLLKFYSWWELFMSFELICVANAYVIRSFAPRSITSFSSLCFLLVILCCFSHLLLCFLVPLHCSPLPLCLRFSVSPPALFIPVVSSNPFVSFFSLLFIIPSGIYDCVLVSSW